MATLSPQSLIVGLFAIAMTVGCANYAEDDAYTNLRSFKGKVLQLKAQGTLYTSETPPWLDLAGAGRKIWDLADGVTVPQGQRMRVIESHGPNPEEGDYRILAKLEGGPANGTTAEIAWLFESTTGGNGREVFRFGPGLDWAPDK